MRAMSILLVLWFATLGSASGQTVSPYAGEEGREIKALSPAEVEGLLAGEGLGLAKTAELNGYPGPLHVLEWVEQMALTPEQREQTQRLFERMRIEAQALGRDLVAAERRLDRSFVDGTVDAESLAAALAEIGKLSGALRAVHLQAHLSQTAILSPAQIARYVAVRGYAGDHHAGGHPDEGHRKKGHHGHGGGGKGHHGEGHRKKGHQEHGRPGKGHPGEGHAQRGHHGQGGSRKGHPHGAHHGKGSHAKGCSGEGPHAGKSPGKGHSNRGAHAQSPGRHAEDGQHCPAAAPRAKAG